MERARKWLQTNIFRRPKVPSLPDEMLVNIFEYLTPEERMPLCLVCKRFRTLELQIGNRKFRTVTIMMLDDNEKLDTFLSDIIVTEMSEADALESLIYPHTFIAKPNGDFEKTTPDISKFFKGAKAESLYLHVARSREPNPSQNLLKIRDYIAVKEIHFYIDCKADFADLIIRFFENCKDRHLKEVTFEYHSLKEQNVGRLCEAMEFLPPLDFVGTEQQRSPDTSIAHDEPESFLVNGPLMLAMIKTAPGILLRAVHCTAQDLLNAFQMICKTGVHKYVILFVVISATVDLLTLAEEQGFLVDRIYVKNRGYTMFAYECKHDSEGCRQVDVRRMNKEGKPIFERHSDSGSD